MKQTVAISLLFLALELPLTGSASNPIPPCPSVDDFKSISSQFRIGINFDSVFTAGGAVFIQNYQGATYKWKAGIINLYGSNHDGAQAILNDILKNPISSTNSSPTIESDTNPFKESLMCTYKSVAYPSVFIGLTTSCISDKVYNNPHLMPSRAYN